ncbi:hypothetical protein K488DRAFT_87751 [Vararia minispora EC-137]|uniref:Uncharacterized protein n=1 Tax=Vararia minispora EC-137 TaxID=1314806 RepID=A0ACB8QF46_9AGAM|nr:hypothetical protein K488DRAFT_87751 [Vararia minispora EC-137]
MLHYRPSLAWLIVLGVVLHQPAHVLAGPTNVTVDDSSVTILFSPPSSWFASTNSSGCAFCLAPADPSVAYKGTWHHGLHILPTSDADDRNNSVAAVSAAASAAASTAASTATNPSASADAGNGGGGGGDKGGTQSKGKGSRRRSTGKDRTRRRSSRLPGRRRDGVPVYSTYYASTSTDAPAVTSTASPFFTQKFDSDDAQFVDSPVFVQFNFSGNAVYVNCLLPLGVPATANNTPTSTNLTFTLDGQAVGNFLHDGSSQASGFQPNAIIFATEGLDLAQHTLRIDLGPDSVFLLDSIVFTQDNISIANSTLNGGTPAVSNLSPAASASDSSSSKDSNVATFGGVLGGVGVLAVIALCTAASIIHRRRRSAKRIAEEREQNADAQSYHTFDEDLESAEGGSTPVHGPQMRGLEPFVPRFFPNTVPSNPPQYAPPQPVTTEDSLDVPPPFSVAISSPEPPLLASIIRRPLDQLQLPAPDALSPAETSDMEEASTTTPLIISYLPRHPRPPSFRSTRSARPSSSALDVPDSQSPDGHDDVSPPPPPPPVEGSNENSR